MIDPISQLAKDLQTCFKSSRNRCFIGDSKDTVVVNCGNAEVKGIIEQYSEDFPFKIDDKDYRNLRRLKLVFKNASQAELFLKEYQGINFERLDWRLKHLHGLPDFHRIEKLDERILCFASGNSNFVTTLSNLVTDWSLGEILFEDKYQISVSFKDSKVYDTFFEWFRPKKKEEIENA